MKTKMIPKPRWEDFIDDDDPRGPSTTEMNFYHEAISKWERGKEWRVKPSKKKSSKKIRE
jgi:hypothetical protein